MNTNIKKLLKDSARTVTFCGLGIDPGDLDPKTIARITVEMCYKYSNIMDIKIIDDNKEFILECEKVLENVKV